MEVSKPVRQGDEGTCVNQDAKSWSKLEPGICNMILEKLPSWERLQFCVVCKGWNHSALKRIERKPYFVTILNGTKHFEYLNGLVVYDVVSKSLSFEPLPFVFRQTGDGVHLAPFAVEGLIFQSSKEMALSKSGLWSDDCLVDVHKNEWCVYNIHTRTAHLLPRAPGCRKRSRGYFCGMTVDTSIKPHTFKIVVSYNYGTETQIYDSASRSWSSHPKSIPNSIPSLLFHYNFFAWFFCMCHKGCMYMSTRIAVHGILVYSMEKDQWSKLSGSPFRGEKRTYLGAWDDRIFAVLHDARAKSVIVWELIDATEQDWVEYARCSKVQYEQLMEHDEYVKYRKCENVSIFSQGELLECCKCEIVSVFSKEYVLMYNWHGGRSYALVLLNLKTREWEPVASIPIMIDETEEMIPIVNKILVYILVSENLDIAVHMSTIEFR